MVADDGDRLLGRTVTVSAKVERAIGDRAVYLGQGAEDKLMAGSAQALEPARAGGRLQVTGTVLRSADGVEERLGIALSDEALSHAGEANSLEAHAVELLPEAGG